MVSPSKNLRTCDLCGNKYSIFKEGENHILIAEKRATLGFDKISGFYCCEKCLMGLKRKIIAIKLSHDSEAE